MSKILIRNGTLITMNAKREIFQGDLILDNRKITAITPVIKRLDIHSDAFDLIIDAKDKVVLPGLIQTHVHLCQTLFRGLADDMALLDWLQKRIWPLEAAHDEESIYYSAMLGCAELFRGGTTCILDMETVHHTDAAIQALLKNGMRAITGKVMMDYGNEVPEELCEKTDDSIRESCILLEKWHGQDDGRIRYAFTPRFAISCTDQLLREVAQLAAHYKVLIHTHASESKNEIDLIYQQRGARNINYLQQVGLTGSNLVLAHCIWLDEQETEILKESQTRVTHCPSANLKLASGIARIPELLEKGILVSLGADGAPCGNNLDMFLEMRLAALIHKVRYGPTAMPAETVLEMATIKGAQALGLDKEIGSLEVGKKADIIILNLQNVHCIPSKKNKLIPRIVYAAKSSDVETTIIDGQVVMLNRKLLTIDETNTINKCHQILKQKFNHIINKLP